MSFKEEAEKHDAQKKNSYATVQAAAVIVNTNPQDKYCARLSRFVDFSYFLCVVGW